MLSPKCSGSIVLPALEASSRIRALNAPAPCAVTLDPNQPSANCPARRIASGPLPPNAADLLSSSRLLTLLSVGLEVFDLIVVDSSPIMGLADAPLLSSVVEATIFVVGAGQVRTKLIRAAIKRLQFSRASLIGTVITRFDARSTFGYGYGYGYGGYGYGYGHEDGGHATEPSIAAAGEHRPKLTKTQAEG